MPFSSITAYFGELDVGTYEVDTDESIWPTVQQNITKGSYLEGRYGFTI